LIQTMTGLTTVSECFGLDEWMTCLILQVSAPGLHQMLACDLMQNLVYLVQLHHCTKARYDYDMEGGGCQCKRYIWKTNKNLVLKIMKHGKILGDNLH